MLFALIGRYRDGAEGRLEEISTAVNEFLGQLLVPPRLAAVLRDASGRRVGNLVIIDAPDFAGALARLRDSPAARAGLYADCEIARLDIEVGTIPPGQK